MRPKSFYGLYLLNLYHLFALKLKHIPLFLATVLILAGCEKQQNFRIGISQCSDDDWRQKMNDEMERELLFHPEATAEIRSANDSNEKQIADIRYFIDNDFDIILASPNEAEAITPIIEEAYNKGIPVVLFDRTIRGDSYTAWQGANNENIGRAAARYIRGMVSPSAPVIEIRGRRGSTPAEGRHAGFEAEGLNVMASAYGNWNYDDALLVADSLMALYPHVQAVFAHNDRMAIAAADAARKLGISPLVIGVDAAPNIGVPAVADGVIDATFIYPTEGDDIIRTAIAILEGEPYTRINSFETPSAIDQTNADILLLQNESLKEEIDRMQRLKAEVDDYWSKHNSQTSLIYSLLVIALLLSGFIFLILRAFWQHRRHRDALEQQYHLVEVERDKQRELNEQLEAATASKLAFFTNVSHDLRTPLTLIAEPVEQLAGADNLTPRQASLMKIADKNVTILRRLINSILDFRKYENGKLELKLEEVDLGKLVAEWSEAFNEVAAKRQFTLEVDTEDFRAAIDVVKFESIFYNLVSNAFKYTPDGGRVTIHCHSAGDKVRLSVADTGQGIAATDLPKVFDQFFQVEHINPNGSGIGLALAKAFVELHRGTISVESMVGIGTTFTVELPLKHVDNEADTAKTGLITTQMVNAELAPVEAPKESSEPGNVDLPTLLVIDDNADIRFMLSDMMADQYRVLGAPSGAEGIRLAQIHTPDLIICDVMMPEMDGIECCSRLKADVATSHIPVLMLTACAMDEQRASGYESGADGYLAKPFNASVLMSRVRNLIENRKHIRQLWNASPSVQPEPLEAENTEKAETQTPEPPSGSLDIDSEFYRSFVEFVTENMSNPDLNIEDLASSMGLGRSQFYRKIKSLTGLSPVELLRRLRLARAHELLMKTERTVSEISYEVGFTTPAYFTKCYRATFGMPPSEARSPK